MTSRFLPLLAWCVVLAALPARARAAGVAGTGTPESCTETALATALAGGGTVTFNCGPAPVSISLAAEHVISASTAIDGGGLVTLSGQDATRLFRVPDAPAPGTSLELRRIDLVGGRCPTAGGVEPGLGGALWAGARAQVILVDVRGRSNTCIGGGAGTGGGFAYVRGGSLRLQRFDGFLNQARDGSAVLAVDSDVTIEDSVFNSSSAVRGGILFATGGRVAFRRNNVLGVDATEAGGALHGTFAPGDGGLLIEDSRMGGFAFGGDGGAIFHQGGPLRIRGSSVTGTARRGGGLFLGAGSVLDIENTTFALAQAKNVSPGDGTGRGGAVYLSGASTGAIRFATFGSNTADAEGGAFAGDGPSAIILSSSVLEGNSTGNLPSCSTVLASGGFNVQDPGPPDADCAPGILRAGPLLGGLGTHGGTTIAFDLLPASAAVDLVTSGCPPPAVDQRAVGRPQNLACDAGALEWIPTVFASYGASIEGNEPHQHTFDVRLSGPFNQTVTVGYATADGTATAGSDYLAASGTLTFPPGVTHRTAPVTILGDQIPELIETFELRLSAAVGGMIGPAALWTILDDDTVPSLSIQNCSVPEGEGSCVMSVQLTSIFGAPVTVSYATGGGTATAGADYTPVAGTLTFAPGSVFETIAIAVVDDAIDEVSETFEVTLSAPQNATIGDDIGEARIDDDDGPTVRLEDAGAFEGTGANSTVLVPVTLSGPSVEAISVNLVTRSGTASSSLDYLHATPSVFFPPGSTSQTAQVTLVGDSLDEPNESFRMEITASGAPVVEGGGRITIRDDDGGDIRLGELSHGTTLRTGLADGPDLYLLEQAEGTSWEVVVDEASGDLGNGNGPLLERLAPDLTTVYQSGAPVGTGTARTMRWASADPQYVRVASQGCSSDCGADDTYRIRAYETTLRAPRFNCVGGQSTRLILENHGSHEIQAQAEAYAASGQSFGLVYLPPLPARGVQVVDVCALPGLAGLSGSLTIAHTASYGQLVGKVVSVDPATGGAFDTPLTSRPR